MRQLSIFFECILLTAFSSCHPTGMAQNQFHTINFGHLARLIETVDLNNRTCDIVHIYAEYPDYNWVDAHNEGIACIDDVARAAVVYLKYYEITRADSLLGPAKRLLDFVLAMQTPDGEFYNFVDSSLVINRHGRTSRKSFSFWAARGYWALGLGFRIFKDKDPAYAHQLQQAFLRCEIPLKHTLKAYQKYESSANRRYPLWLLNQTGADVTSEFLLGLSEYLKIDPLPRLKKYALQLAEGILEMQQPRGSIHAGAFLSWKNVWHGYCNAQTQALARLGQILNNQKLINAAKFEADHYFTDILINGLKREWRLAEKYTARSFPQIAYDIRCIALGLLRLHEVTGEEKYAIFAGLTASWLLGNNPAHTCMYDSLSGRTFDGINDSSSVNLNAGAESTIEGLYTMIEILANPIARKYIFFQTEKKGELTDQSTMQVKKYRTFSNPAGAKIGMIKTSPTASVKILRNHELDMIK